MTKRREFSKPVSAEIIKRAMDPLGFIRCEGCGAVVKPGQFAIDHIIAEELIVDKSKKLTAADGQLLCTGARDTCHGRKTGEFDQPAISEAKRREAKHLGATRPAGKLRGAPFPKFAQAQHRVDRDPKPHLPPRQLYVPK